MNCYEFERCFVSFVSKLAVEKYGNHSSFARVVFPEAESPINVWRNVRNGNRGKLRDITLKDACNMAQALEMDLETLCWKVHREIKEGWTPAQDVCHQEETKPGRPKKSEAEHPPAKMHSAPLSRNEVQ